MNKLMTQLNTRLAQLKQRPLALALLAAFALSTGGIMLYSGPSTAADDKDKKSAPTPALTVTTTRPQGASLPLRLTANGNVAAWQEASIGSESNGLRLTEVRVNVGDVVKKGEVLAVFSADTVNADVAQAKAALAEAQANAAEAQANAKRARAVQASGALSEQQVTQYLTAEQTANARIESARAALAAQQLRLKYTQVVAPDAGVISARSATVGAVVGAGTELFRMIRQGRLEWRAEVTAAELKSIRVGSQATVRAANGSELTGKVRTIAPTVDPQTRSALVYVDLPPDLRSNAPFKAGMFASGQFDLGASNALTLPQQAVVVRDGFPYVFRLNADSRVSQLKVQTGRRLGDRIEIVSGVTGDMPVVLNGAGFLNDGDLVKAVAAPAAAAPGAPRQAQK
ncbi:RND family efflux transporter MFP subunit [Pseudoduganella flava]|uniref:Efflux RND transporter periplasmic adaptor subunit n=1 Tax=Pseudoduganella flava TaxID=871742 RepID=A0A562PV71_9BURK|nr:efflux RND transporter periplasmic adaptor subunit [Pseudoduganella flava]QGZ39468.1 efflux RND transporter periplasmic adaptor subunit [Pseudoduganella flava]TWI48352.1 RND family efflux transporter MFP subunit [Pseudoduganella flava]